MHSIIAIIPGLPIPKGRPRFVNGRVVTPSRTRDAEEYLAWQVKAQNGLSEPLLGSIAVSLLFLVPANDASDLDNLVKLALDALNGVVWADDHQVTYLSANVIRSDDHEAHTSVFIWGESMA